MSADLDREFVMNIDDRRSIRGVPTHDGKTVVLTVEDPHSIAIVELTQTEVGELVLKLAGLYR